MFLYFKPLYAKGVLVTEKSVNEEFSIMGIIVDAIEDIIQDYYPGKCFTILNLYMLMDTQL